MPYAGFWIRVVASLIDSLILIVPTVLIVWFASPPMAADLEQAQTGILPWLMVAALEWIYFAGLESSESQASLGKRIVNIVVTDTEGQRIPFSVASMRAWPMYLPTLGVALAVLADTPAAQMLTGLAGFVSCVAVAFTQRKQGFHDMMANCLVVYKTGPLPAGNG
jgi:uncharacterized RDD family membrane protein YckC